MYLYNLDLVFIVLLLTCMVFIVLFNFGLLMFVVWVLSSFWLSWVLCYLVVYFDLGCCVADVVLIDSSLLSGGLLLVGYFADLGSHCAYDSDYVLCGLVCAGVLLICYASSKACCLYWFSSFCLSFGFILIGVYGWCLLADYSSLEWVDTSCISFCFCSFLVVFWLRGVCVLVILF